MYKVGDAIPGGATLFAVEPFRVILERNGRHESLSLPRPSMESSAQTSAVSNFQPSRNNALNSLPNTTLPTNSNTNNRHNEKQALIEEMARIRKKFAK